MQGLLLSALQPACPGQEEHLQPCDRYWQMHTSMAARSCVCTYFQHALFLVDTAWYCALPRCCLALLTSAG